MILKCTDEQVSQMAALAVNNSIAVGMGFLHYEPDRVYQPSAFPVDTGRISIDYCGGRMTKFRGKKIADDQWEFPDVVRTDYQSWCERFAGYDKLLEAVIAG